MTNVKVEVSLKAGVLRDLGLWAQLWGIPLEILMGQILEAWNVEKIHVDSEAPLEERSAERAIARLRPLVPRRRGSGDPTDGRGADERSKGVLRWKDLRALRGKSPEGGGT